MDGLWLQDIESLEAISQDDDTRNLFLRMAQLSQDGRLAPFLRELKDDRELDDAHEGHGGRARVRRRLPARGRGLRPPHPRTSAPPMPVTRPAVATRARRRCLTFAEPAEHRVVRRRRGTRTTRSTSRLDRPLASTSCDLETGCRAARRGSSRAAAARGRRGRGTRGTRASAPGRRARRGRRVPARVGAHEPGRDLVDHVDRLVDDPLVLGRARVPDVAGVDADAAARLQHARPGARACPRGRRRGGSRSSRRARRRSELVAEHLVERTGAAARPSGSGGAGTRPARRRGTARARRAGTSASCRRSPSRPGGRRCAAAGGRARCPCHRSSRPGRRRRRGRPRAARR